MTDLLPCPFCGSSNLDDQGPSYTQIMCNDCGAHEYDQPSREEAIAAWNRRAAPPPPVQQGEAVAWADAGAFATFARWETNYAAVHLYKQDSAMPQIEGHRVALYLAPPSREQGEAFQQRVAPWMGACFGAEISADRLERGDRALEEFLELLQSGHYPRERVAALTAYVYGRPAGEPHQEVGGVMVTLAAYCLAHGLDMHQAAEDELARVWTKIDTIRAKQAGKPTGSALPVATPPSRKEGLREALKEIASELDDVGDWINNTVPIPTSRAIPMLGKVRTAATAIRRALSHADGGGNG